MRIANDAPDSGAGASASSSSRTNALVTYRVPRLAPPKQQLVGRSDSGRQNAARLLLARSNVIKPVGVASSTPSVAFGMAMLTIEPSFTSASVPLTVS